MKSRTALVTGANQGLGRALVAGLAARLRPADRVLLTGRDPERVRAAAAALPTTGARVDGRVLDVRDPDAITALAAELGEVDIVFSNATSRMRPDADPAAEVDAVAETNNLATSARAAGVRPAHAARRPADHRGQRVGHARQARRARPRPVRRRRHAASTPSTRSSTSGAPPSRPGGREFGTWLNIPSKVAQVAAVRAIARERRDEDLARGVLVAALCPGLIDTAASRPWFADMSSAQTPDEAAAWPVELAVGEAFDPAFYGELVQFGRVLPWETGIPVPHRATA